MSPLYALLIIERGSGEVLVHLNAHGRPWRTTGGAQRMLKAMAEQTGPSVVYLVVPVVPT